MKVLALDASGLVAGVAVADEDTLVGEYTINYKKTHSQTLLPMLDELKRNIDLDLQTIDVIAVTAGPGSFTGLRIGAATAKGLGQALDKPVVGVPTLEALAYNLWGARGDICPIMDARRQQTYTGIYHFDREGNLEVIRDQCAVDIADIVLEINARGREVTFLGDGVPVFADYIKENCTVPYRFAPAQMNRQKAGAVAALGMVYAKEGKAIPAEEFRPIYLRKSQAEREREEKIARGEI